MSELISGKEAWIALYDGFNIQIRLKDVKNEWLTIKHDSLTLSNIKNDIYEYRLEPRTITLNGIEVPAPFEPKEDCIVFIIDDGKTCNYRQYDYEFGAEDESNWIGIWRTESDIKQVVAALRSIFSSK